MKLPKGMTFNQILIIHGVLMFIAWGLTPIAAIYIARFCKHWGHKWFVWHRGLFIGGTGIGSLIGFLAVVLFRNPPHFNSAHSVIYIHLDFRNHCTDNHGFTIYIGFRD